MPAPPHSINSSALTIRRTGVTEYWIGTAASVCLDIGRPNHLAPLLDFVGDELAKVRGRARKRCAPQSAIRAFSLGSARPALISLFSLSTISAGVAFGAPRPNQPQSKGAQNG
jgi:hypothetical protein